MPFIKRMLSKKGFTLIELIITTVLVALISFAIYLSVSNGVKIWKKIYTQTDLENLYIMFDKFGRDLKNTFSYQGIYFSGTVEKVEFPTLVYSSGLKRKTVGKVFYFYDEKNHSLNRQQWDYSEVYLGETKSLIHTVNNVKFLRFQYYFFDKDKREYLWKEEWQEEGFPLAVRLELGLDYGKEIENFTKTVSIPISG